MAIKNQTQLIDILTTLLLFAGAIVAIYVAQGYSGRAGMWPTYVMGTLLVLVCIHLFNLARDVFRPSQEKTDTDSSEQGV